MIYLHPANKLHGDIAYDCYVGINLNMHIAKKNKTFMPFHQLRHFTPSEVQIDSGMRYVIAFEVLSLKLGCTIQNIIKILVTDI